MTRFIFFWLFLFLHTFGLGQSETSTDVLFIGNSYTYFWNLPQVVKSMAESQDKEIFTRQSTAGGANLGHHWKGERNLQSRSLVKSGKWEYVVLQDHSLRAIEAVDSLNYYVRKWHKEIVASGALPILYMTWAREFNPLMTNPIVKGYEDIAASLGIPVIPVGKIWSKARSLRPDLALYDPDGSHPSPLGTYLTACAFYEALSGSSAVGLPNRLTSEDKNGEKIYLSIISNADATFCQQVVHEVLAEYALSILPKLHSK